MAEPAAFPLTEAQSGLWYFQRLDPLNPILNTGQYLEIRGALDVAAFTAAVAQAIAETEALRLRFRETREGPVQWLADAPVAQVVDLSHLPDPAVAAQAAMAADSDRPLDLARDPLAAFTLFILGPRHFFWYERIHHLAIDGFGMVLFTNRVAELYSERSGGAPAGPALAPLAQALAEDAEYRAAAKRATDAAYWREAMAGLPEVAGLTPGRAVSAHHFHRETLRFNTGQMAGLHALAEGAGVTWPDALTGLVAAYCQRFTGAPEVVVGVPHMGRLGSRAARVPCMVMNVLPLRIAPDDALPLADYLRGVAKALMRGRRHGRYRSEQLRRDLGLIGGARRLHGPLINVQPFDIPPKIQGLDVHLHILGAGAVEDITFTFRGDATEGLVFEADSNPDLYTPEATRAHALRLMAFIARACTAQSLGDVPTASPQEAQRFLYEANATAHPLPDTSLTALIEQSLRATPEATALVFDGREMSYAEFDRRTAALAARLQALGAGRETVVAVALDRAFELPIALVAVLRAGAAYLPLDPAHPPARIARILARAKPVCVLTTPDLADLFPADTPLLQPQDWPQTGTPQGTPASGDLAYVIFTSGSTGEPKGVMIEHRAIVNRLEWMRSHYGFGPEDRILQKTPATFDVSVWEFFLSFLSGATLVIAPPGAHRDPGAIADLIRSQGVSTAHFVPSMLSAFLASPASDGLRMARVFCSGEELTADQRDRFHQCVQAELHNLYGPTEAAVDVSYWPATPRDHSSPVPIGFPVWNTRLLVLDDRMLPVPAGVAGQLYLGGVQLARGYLGQPELTAERFIPDPFTPGARLYHTGDLARWREDGAVVFLGRADHQVKIRGLRIELGEIEAGIMAFGPVRETAVIAREDRPGDKRIVAYLVPAPGYEEAALRRHLAALMPDYMIPTAFVALPALPVTANGKLDRAALPAPQTGPTGDRLPREGTEAALAALYAEVLGLAGPVGADGDFFSLGGDSLLAVHLLLRVQEVFGRDPGLGSLFEHPTVAALAVALDAGRAEDDGLGPLIRLAGAGQAAPLFLIHPAGGIAWGYRDLARALDGRLVYGLQSPALNAGHPLPESLDALAEEYVARILALCPEGPWHLAGWSVGGIIAHAMAVHLRARGLEPGLVAMLDSYPADCWRAQPEPDPVTALRSLLAVAGYDPEAHPELTSRAAIVAFLRAGDSALGNLPEPVLDGVIRTVTDTNRLVRGQFHRRYDGGVTHISATHDPATGLRPELWAPYVARLDTFAVPFLHAQLTSSAATALIAPELVRRLAEIDRKAEIARCA